MLDIFGGIISKIMAIVLIVVGFLLLVLSGLAKWLGLLLAIIGAVMIFGNPIFGIIAIVVGILLFKFGDIASTIIKIIGLLMMAWGIVTLLGVAPLGLIPVV